MTQYREAMELGIDATFFRPVSEGELMEWERTHKIELPPAWRELYSQTNGVEACSGKIETVLPLDKCEVLPKGRSLEFPWVEFGKTELHRYFINTGSDTVYRINGSEPEFFASTLGQYLKLIFQGKG